MFINGDEVSHISTKLAKPGDINFKVERMKSATSVRNILSIGLGFIPIATYWSMTSALAKSLFIQSVYNETVPEKIKHLFPEN